jgi:hypothetical protein
VEAVWSKVEGQYRWEQRTVPGDDVITWIEVDAYGRIVGGIDISRAQFSEMENLEAALTVAQMREHIGQVLVPPPSE